MLYRILLVEDETHLRENIRTNLEMEGYEVVSVATGREALRHFREQRFNLAILDVMLPEMSGYDICEQIRLEDSHIPILFLTAKDTPQDIVQGLKRGADDYLTKPFHLDEFLLRTKALLKRSTRGDERKAIEAYNFGPNRVDFSTYQVITPQGKIQLTKKELKLLKLFIERENEVVSRQDILKNVWGYDVYPSTRTIDNFILAFRKYFEPDPRNPVYFHSVRGVGYQFTPGTTDKESGQD